MLGSARRVALDISEVKREIALLTLNLGELTLARHWRAVGNFSLNIRC